MTTKIQSKLTNVPETMLIPLRARYKETQLPNGIINDPKSVEILDAIDYDFSGKKEVSIGSQKGVAIRTEIFDEQTNDFLKRHPDGIVVNIGCGLDTRYHRLKRKGLQWFDLDVPEAIELRRHFFTEDEGLHFIPKSVLDFSWVDDVPKGRPTLFLAEGVLMYFAEDDVKKILTTIAQHFADAEILIEAMSPFMARRSNRHPDVKKYNAGFQWGIQTGKEIDNWHTGFSFVTEYFYNRHLRQMPFYLALLFKLMVGKAMKIIQLRTSSAK